MKDQNPPIAFREDAVMRTAISATLALVIASCLPSARADVVTLKGGRQVEGKVRIERAEDAAATTASPRTDSESQAGGDAAADRIVVETRLGAVYLDPIEVAEIEYGETFEEKVDRELAAVLAQANDDGAGTDGDTGTTAARVSRLVDLARACVDRSWPAMARDLWLTCLSLDPDSVEARAALGYQRVDGQWVTESELMVAKGLVKHAGEWVHPDEVKANESAEYWRKMQSKVDRLKTKMASKVSARREQAYEEMIGLESEIPGIVQAADTLRDYYDRYYRALAARGEAVVEIRATHAALRRPVEVFETTLATGSVFSAATLVQIQIPEINVTSVKTTVTVPLVKYDEDDE